VKRSSPIIITALTLLLLASTGCRGYRKLLQDEVLLQNGSSHTGTIEHADSASVTIKKPDLSHQRISWDEIDTISSLSYKTTVFSFYLGIHSTPYYSVFQNENYTPAGLGAHWRIGTAKFGKSYRYVTLGRIAGKPYGITKLGVGIQRYLFSKYIDPYAFYIGCESNLMFVRNNNVPQVTLEPFLGGDFQLQQQLRLSVRLGFQKNILGMNPALGVNFSAGIHFLFRDFDAHYSYLNERHCLPRRFNP
jgi:hypothetical protein